MRALAFHPLQFCAALLAGLAVHASVAHAACDPPHVVATLDLLPQNNGMVFVPVTIGGERHYFSLGTASPISTVTPALVQHLALIREHFGVTMIDTAGRDTNSTATVPQFALGGLTATSQRFLIEADTQATTEPIAAADAITSGEQRRVGTLGADFLRAYDVDLDFGARKMRLIAKDHCDGQILFWKSELMAKLPIMVTDENKITFPMTLDGHELQAVLSSNTPNTAISLRAAGEVYDVKNGSAGNEPAGQLNDTRLYAHRFQSLSAGGLTISNPRLVLLPDLVQDAVRHLRRGRRPSWREPRLPDLILGMSTLRQLHLYIAYHEQALYVSPAAPSTQTMPLAVPPPEAAR
jgi:hypothetical protein